MGRGIINNYKVAANVALTSTTTLTTVGLTSPIAANQTQKIRAWVPLTVGATGGVRLQVVVPAGGTLFTATIRLYNTVAPADITAIQTSSAVFTNALANAGTHWVLVEAYVLNGATAGSVDIQFAQNTSDPLTLTILKGGWMETTIL